MVLNAVLVLHINNELNNFFSIRKNNLNTNSHRHQGLHLLAHQLKMTPLRCWRSHWGVCKWTLSHHLRTCPGDRWPSCHWWWSVLSGSAALEWRNKHKDLVKGKHLPTLVPNQFPQLHRTLSGIPKARWTKLVKRTVTLVFVGGKNATNQTQTNLRKLCLKALYVYAVGKETKIKGSLETFFNSFSQMAMWLSASQQHTQHTMDAKEVVFLYFLPIAWTILWFRQNKTESYTENQCITQCRRTKQCRGTWVPSCAKCSSYSSWSPLAGPFTSFAEKHFFVRISAGSWPCSTAWSAEHSDNASRISCIKKKWLVNEILGRDW